ncbi:aminoacylase-1 isoform X1 [Folsomia candida]|uniref:aminoacylase-1 isoform X1 n=1 Tax=Folsomia candida TaxID=158441 RepID=UPI000B90948E|nr:aminoacylase-1 isoform X1 [Folsomia candida]
MAQENIAVTNFREYLRIKTVHPEPDYENAIVWLKKQAIDLGLEFHIVEFPKPNEFAVWLTWQGKDVTLKSVLLNSHIDVVPVDATKWTYDPFGAEKDANGNIFARGSQDMKCVGVQYLEAIRNLKARGVVPLRTVHVSFVPDEEVGGYKGMACFVKSPEFASLNVGFALDEGIASPDESFHVFYGERAIWQFRMTAKGKTGHASILHEDTAAEKIHKIINKLLGLREVEKARLKSNPNFDLGDVTSVNMTMLSGGLQPNVVPPELSVVFDMRITPHWKLDDMKKMLDDLCIEAGPEVSYDYIQHSNIIAQTALNDSNVWWTTFKSVTDSLSLNLNKKIFPAATDIRFMRQLEIPAFGFSPMNNTPVLLHDHDEFLNETVFLRGVEIYEAILDKIVNVTKSDSTP